MPKPDIKVLEKADNIEITVGLSATVPIANYENLKPLYSIKAEFDKNKITQKEIDEVIAGIKTIEYNKLDDDYVRGLKKAIEKERDDLRFYEIDGKLYPSVTSILNPFGIDYDPYLLAQYASRGTIVHHIAEKMILELKDGKALENIELVDPTEVDELKDDVETVTKGSKGLKWDDCSPKSFWKKYGKDFDLSNAVAEQRVKNPKYEYAGTMDLNCKYKGKRAVLDWKTAKNYGGKKLDKYFAQSAAYAKCVGAEIIIIAPLKPSNKSGYGKPYITDDIESHWQNFIKMRQKFKELYGV